MKRYFLKIKIAALIIVSVMILMQESSIASQRLNFISPKEVRDLISEGSRLWIVDVRGKSKFEKYHIEGSLQMGPLELKVSNIKKQKIIILVDDSLGLVAAKESMSVLAAKGNKRVYMLSGGVKGWEDAGFTVVGVYEEVKTVSSMEMKVAAEKNVPLNIFDFRNKKDIDKFSFEGSQAVEGKKLGSKVKKFKSFVNGRNENKLASRLRGHETLLILLPEEVAPETFYDKYLRGFNEDIRFLKGNTMVWSILNNKRTSVVKGCESCGAPVRGELR